MAAALLADIIGIEAMNSRTKSINYYSSSKMVNMLLLGAISYTLWVMALKGTYNKYSLTNGLLISIAQNKLTTLENRSATTIIGAEMPSAYVGTYV